MAGYFGTKVEGEADQGPDDSGKARDDETTVDGELCFTISTKGKTESEAHEDYLRQVDRLGYKIGLRLRREQQVQEFRFRRQPQDVQMIEDAQVTADLTSVLGAPPEERWIGFVPDTTARRTYTFPEGCVVCYEFVLRLAPRARLPLLIPIVIRHNNGHSFADSFISGLLTVRGRRRA